MAEMLPLRALFGVVYAGRWLWAGHVIRSFLETRLWRVLMQQSKRKRPSAMGLETIPIVGESRMRPSPFSMSKC